MKSGMLPPTIDQIAAMGQAILASLPGEIRDLVGDVPVTVVDWPDDHVLDETGITDALELTGLYRATPIGERHAMLAPVEPEMIFLYRMPILFEWCERACPLEHVVFDVLTHEIGHHLGMDEDQVGRMEGRLG
ncbi:MAG: metallopeptidase family protein [Geminicoccaceae bacterium]|nr:metallopeptidase family protein [Geminicoccaceae bacterium]